jgi:hypothetical protein
MDNDLKIAPLLSFDEIINIVKNENQIKSRNHRKKMNDINEEPSNDNLGVKQKRKRK